MPKFEYLTFRTYRDTVGWISSGKDALKDRPRDIHTFLNEHGAEGWELVSVIAIPIDSPNLLTAFGLGALAGERDSLQQCFLRRVVAG